MTGIKMIEGIVTSTTMLEGGRRFKEFVGHLEQLETSEQEHLIEQFWERLLEQSVDGKDSDTTGKGYMICPQERLVATCMSLQMSRKGSFKEDLEDLKAHVPEFSEQYFPAEGFQFNSEGIEELLDDLETRHGVISALYPNRQMIVMLHGGEDFSGSSSAGWYNQYEDDGIAYGHFSFFPDRGRSFAGQIMGLEEEIAKLLGRALCFAAYCKEGLPYNEQKIPSDILKRVNDCGFPISEDATDKETVRVVSEMLGKAMILGSELNGPAFMLHEKKMESAKKALQLETLKMVLDRARSRREQWRQQHGVEQKRP